MNILVACEESQAVTVELRQLGHNAFSCDIEPCSGGHPEWHIQQDVLPLLDGDCEFDTVDGAHHFIVDQWDMLIAFPPCTDLAVSGAAWFEQKRKDGRQQKSIEFFMQFANANCENIAIENPVGIMSTYWRKPNQRVQPYEYGDPFEKTTCLWTKNLPPLTPTNIVTPPPRAEFSSGKSMPAWYAEAWKLPPKQRAALRSRTFPGIAKAMAQQWAGQAS